LPKVVVAELVAHYGRELRARLRGAEKALNELQGCLYSSESPIISVDVRELEAGYESHLQNRLDELYIGVASYPAISHETAVKRALAHKRPFNQKDRGYKDTLIWESALDQIRQGATGLLLVSKDRGFALEGKLHPHLLEDTRALGTNDNDVKLAEDYDSAIEQLDSWYDVLSMLEEEEWAGVTKEELAKVIPFAETLENQKEQILGVLQGSPACFPDAKTPDSVYLPWDVEPDQVDFEAEYVGSGEWKVEGKALWETEVEYIDLDEHSDYWHHDEEMPLAIRFTLYYDYVNKVVTEVSIDDVTRTDVPW
jgi:hypothetical protein